MITTTKTDQKALVIEAALLNNPQMLKAAKALAEKFRERVAFLGDIKPEEFPPVKTQQELESEHEPKDRLLFCSQSTADNIKKEVRNISFTIITPQTPTEFKNLANDFLALDTLEAQFKAVMKLLKEARSTLNTLPKTTDESLNKVAADAADAVIKVYNAFPLDAKGKPRSFTQVHLGELRAKILESHTMLAAKIKEHTGDGKWFKIPRPIRFILGILASLTLITPALMIPIKGYRSYMQTFFYKSPTDSAHTLMTNFKQGMERIQLLQKDISSLKGNDEAYHIAEAPEEKKTGGRGILGSRA